MVGVGRLLRRRPYGLGGRIFRVITGGGARRSAKLAWAFLSHGRRFDAVLEYLIAQTGCGLTMRSHFFSSALPTLRAVERRLRLRHGQLPEPDSTSEKRREAARRYKRSLSLSGK